jgi:hypothetical protein
MAEETSIIYGINATGGLGEVENFDQALINLGLNPVDLNKIGAIANSSTGLDREEFYTLSGSNENLFRRISNTFQASRDIVFEVEKSAGAQLATTQTGDGSNIDGNLVVNGPIGAPAIRYFSNTLLQTGTNNHEPVDISTSRISSWSRQGTTLSYGGDLLIDSEGKGSVYTSSDRSGYTNNDDLTTNSPALGVGKFIIDGTVGKTTITPKTFAAEQPTHKLKTTINGKEYYMYAMKNIPLIFNGTFRGRGGSISVAEVTLTTGNPSFRVIRKSDNLTQDTFNQDELFVSNTDTSARDIEVYANPKVIQKLDLGKGTGSTEFPLNITNFPNAEYDELTNLQFNDNLLETMPNFKIIAPKLTSLNLANNPLFKSPQGSLFEDNRLTQSLINKIPAGTNAADTDGIKTLNLSGCFKGEVTADFKATFPNLTTLQISGSTGVNLNSPGIPEIPTTVDIYSINNQRFTVVPGTAVTKVINDTPQVGADLRIDGAVNGRGKLTIRRRKDLFEVIVNSPGGYYTSNGQKRIAIANPNGEFANGGVTGAGSPHGIPFGNIVCNIASGNIQNAYFSPAGCYSNGPTGGVDGNSDTPKPWDIRAAGRAFAVANSQPEDFVKLGYYVDGGLFSSPMQMTVFRTAGDGFINGVNNRQHAFYNLAMPNFGAHGVSASPHSSYFEDFKTWDGNGCDRHGIPILSGLTKLESFNSDGDIDTSVDNVNTKLERFYGKNGFEPLTVTDICEMFTLIDSPTGQYKFANCSGLKNVYLESFNIRGKLPKFAGNTSLAGWRTYSLTTYDHEASTSNSPVGLPHDQFDSCKTTLSYCRFQFAHLNNSTGLRRYFDVARATKKFGSRPNASPNGDNYTQASFDPSNINNNPGRVRYDSTFTYNPAPFGRQDSPNGPMATDKLTKVRVFAWLNTNSTKGPLPSFKGASNGPYWLHLGNNKFGQDYTYTMDDGKSKTISGGLLQDYRFANSNKTHLRYWWIYSNNLKGNLDFAKLMNPDSTTTDDPTRLEYFHLMNNELDKIANWGNTELTNLKHFLGGNAFRGADQSNADVNGTEYAIPSCANKLPKIIRLRLEQSGTGLGPFSSFEDNTLENFFDGCVQLNELDLRGNKFDGDNVMHVLRALKNLTDAGGKQNIQVKFERQKNSVDELLDFRIVEDGNTVANGARSIEDNRFIQDLKNPAGDYKYTITGIRTSIIPDPPDAPPFTVTFNFSATRTTVSGINLGPLTGAVTEDAILGGTIPVTLNISQPPVGTRKLQILKQQWNGNLVTVAELTTGLGADITQTDTIRMSGTTVDLNLLDSNWVTDTGAEQEVKYIVKALGLNDESGTIRSITQKFINITQTV